jgi:hypothetical protein
MLPKPIRWILLLAGALALVIIPQIGNRDSGKTGEELAHTYCASCHLFPEPALLDKKTWTTGVLPEMGLRIGIGDRHTVLNRMSFQLFDKLCNLGIYPAQASITPREWKRITEFYTKNAPDSLTAPKTQQHSTPIINPFHLRPVPRIAQGQLSLARFVPDRKEIWTFDRNGEWNRFDLTLQLLSSQPTPGPIVDAVSSDPDYLLSIGNMLPNEDRKGRLFSTSKAGRSYLRILDSLHRPVQALHLDMDGNGTQDWLIAEFGFETGALRWFEEPSETPHTLSDKPGARNIVPVDADTDGDTDLLVLFAQAMEEVVLFRNEGKGRYTPVNLLSFPAIHGSSWMEYTDMDGDGDPDLILANGDNADYSITPKPYHGVRIFLNDSRLRFRQTFFHPVPGATKVLARDFDRDGDKDLALIAFFSTDKAAGSFLYFENDGKGRFRFSNLGVPPGEWLVMEADDMDRDGDQDLILGRFLMSEDPAKDKDSPAALVLENQSANQRPTPEKPSPKLPQ